MNYVRAFLQDPLVATIAGTSPIAARKIVREANLGSARCVVEYGAGDGVLTRHILNGLSSDARLIALETNARLAEKLSGIRDERLTVYQRSAADIEEIVCGPVDVIVSGIPFSLIPQKAAILDAAARVLAPNGRFVAYQVTPRLFKDLRARYEKVSANVAPINIPPLFVLTGERPLR
ncbi:methyltransferase [Candidatus Woesearchaeota archaeon]|nr:MAG: methyltransferase [Candidatus Woesearchaeota archaeon]